MKGSKKEKLSNTLKELEPEVTREMKLAAALKYEMGFTTVNEYLTGAVGNVPAAEALVKFFKKQINSIATA